MSLLWVPSAGRSLATFSQGEGPAVLLIHGFGSTHAINWVHTGWVSLLVNLGKRVIAFDNRGHGQSGKFYEPEAYDPALMAEDARRVLDAYGIDKADVMGYSMGARISAFLAVSHPERIHRLVLGGIGLSLVTSSLEPGAIEQALLADDINAISDPVGLMFRKFADANGQDVRALAACIRGSRRGVQEDMLTRIHHPTMVAVGTRDSLAGDGDLLAQRLPSGLYVPIPGREHNPAVGDKVFKAEVQQFLV